MQSVIRHLAGPILAIAMLTGVLGTTSLHLTPADAGGYHAAVKAAIEAVPYAIGDWIGKDVPVPTQATDMLKPNAILSREYVHTPTGQRVGILLVQTLDARDLVGHYPPECYPANGWTLTGREAVKMPLGADQVETAHYSFAMNHFAGNRRLEVYNLLILPDGQYSIGMAGLHRISGSYQLRHLGAAGFQLLPDPDLTDEQQTQAWKQFTDALSPVFELIRQGERASAAEEAG